MGDSVFRYVDIVGEHGSHGASSFGDATGKATAYEALISDAGGVEAWFRGTYEVIALLYAEDFSLYRLDVDTLQRLMIDSAKHQDVRTMERISTILRERCSFCSPETNSIVPQ